MKHILLINHTRSLHGAEHVLLQTIEGLKAEGFRVSVVVPRQVPDQGLDAILPPVDTVLRLPYKVAGVHLLRTLAIIMYNLPAMIRLCRWIRKEEVDVIYSNTSTTILGIAAAWWTKRKHLWHFHESVDKLYGWHHSMGTLYHLLASYPRNTMVYLSQRQRHEWEQTIGQHPFAVIYNPIRQLVKEEKEDHNNIRFGYLGSFEPRKNLPFLLHSFGRLHCLFPNTELWLCGGKDENEIASLYAQTDLHDPVVRILPHTFHSENFYSQIDVLVLPSKKEVMPLVAIEAMAAGVAVIQTTESGLNELLEDGKDCLFVHPNDEEVLLKSMQEMMNEAKRQQLAHNGQQQIQNADFNQRYISDLKQLL